MPMLHLALTLTDDLRLYIHIWATIALISAVCLHLVVVYSCDPLRTHLPLTIQEAGMLILSQGQEFGTEIIDTEILLLLLNFPQLRETSSLKLAVKSQATVAEIGILLVILSGSFAIFKIFS